MNRILCLLMLFVFTGCGTEIGNPELVFDAVPGNAALASGFVMLNKSCDKLMECYTSISDRDTCQNKMLREDNFDTAFGLTEDLYANLEEIFKADDTRMLLIDETELENCNQEIMNLNCTDPEVINAFDDASPNDYSNAYKIIPNSSGACQKVYSTTN